ncbi:MAG: zinc-binding dehydrogenase [Rhodospirillales bacterium]|nr:MAG: zinc-binding dehydrogenase [Rhodospirillales bacterium]
MRAAVFRAGDIVADTIPDPVPTAGQVLVRTLVCGICGSDLHARKHAHRMVDIAKRTPGREPMDLSRDIVFGHEFCGELLENGPGTAARFKPGARVCSVPMNMTAQGPKAIGYSNIFPGGFGERMVLSEALLLEIPNGLSADRAALTEPLAVGIHAVEKAAVGPEDVPLVIGCGPVGLAVIAALKRKGAGPIVAADYSPARRRLAERMGAHVVVDPAIESPYRRWEDHARRPDGGAAVGAILRAAPSPFRPALVFECVGVPGVIQQVFENVPRDARVVVVGVCMEVDKFEPMFGIVKELNVQFVLAYTLDEYAAALRAIAEGEVDADALITGKVGIDGVRQAFEDLADPETHTKILVEPWR